MQFPTPHYEKLLATLQNDKLPASDQPIIGQAIARYQKWVADLSGVIPGSTEDTAARLVALLNDYRLYLDVEVIFDREDDFLYRQKGQTKLDNSVIEEFLPYLVYKCVMHDRDTAGISLGPNTTFSAIYFASSLAAPAAGGGMRVRTKDQDFAVAKAVHLRASHDQDFASSTDATAYLV